MLVCHQCGHKIEIFSNINNIRCSNCRTTYVSKPLAPLTTAPVVPAVETSRALPINESPYSSSYDSYSQNTPPETPNPVELLPKVSLRDWGTFEMSFLEQIKAFSMPHAYQKEITKKNRTNFQNLPIIQLLKNSILIGRKSSTTVGFEDVDIKLENQDGSISRRQCVFEIDNLNNQINITLSTHQNAANLVEVNGKPIERNYKRLMYAGEFIRLGNTIFELIVQKPEPNSPTVDMDRTILF
jgi:hypothetical protein